MVVLSNYEELVKVCVEEKVDMIICGSGLPMDLPKLTAGSDIKLIPIVSSARAFNIIYKKWKQNYNRVPDAVVLEGPMAGGHLGFSYDEINNHTARTLEELVSELVEYIQGVEETIPVIAAGGIWDGNDIARFLKLGASGVQMATRFVCTDECDVHLNFKMAYINSKEEDITIIKSPVGMPGRVIRNEFVKRIVQGERMDFNCEYHCLYTCDPKKVNYCIAKALLNASRGQMDKGFAMCGSNAYRIQNIVSVKELISELVMETRAILRT